MVRMSSPFTNKLVAKECRKVCAVTRLWIPLALTIFSVAWHKLYRGDGDDKYNHHKDADSVLWKEISIARQNPLMTFHIFSL
ncbi:MAG: hypothetical protein ACJAUP_003544 [Cellvibrionaceae bacterium]|jgi:hypothetical protein